MRGFLPVERVDPTRWGYSPRAKRIEVNPLHLAHAQATLARSGAGWLAGQMEFLTQGSLLPIIQLSITPVILISGMGALMLTLTGRMGRIVDRTRILAGQLHAGTGANRAHLEGQLDIMWRRAQLIRRAVTFNGLSMLVACLLIIALFASALLQREMPVLLMGLFGTSILLLIAALVAFMHDIGVSLHALKLEVDRARGAGANS